MPHSYVHPTCKHPQDQRTKLDSGRIHCAACDRTFTSPKSPVRHGTTRGYARHKRQRTTAKQGWPWPVPLDTCGCIEAQRAYQSDTRTAAIKERRVRDAARQAALLDLRRQFPGEYQRHYIHELAKRNLTGLQDPGHTLDWDSVMNRLVKVAFLGMSEADLRRLITSGQADAREREMLRLVYRLRALFSEKNRRPA